jgi:nitrate reductase assembly molybdenum cofactor insertion protein NarJ
MIAYRLFSYLLSYPTEEVRDAVRKLTTDKSVSRLKSVGIFNTVDLADLQTEYTRLFVNSYPTLPCPPYESFYREGTVYGNTVNEVVALYGQQGLEYTYQGEPPDHISAELDFLAETGSKEFLDRMQQWVPEFTARIKEMPTVYGVIAQELEELIS